MSAIHAYLVGIGRDSASSPVSDVTPNSVNWGDLTDTDFPIAQGTNVNQTISGIDTTITISFTNSGTADVIMFINNVAFATTSSTITNADTIKFKVSTNITSGGVITVINETDGGAVLDTFSYSLFVTDGFP